ncbi:exosortase/archaeosortase family protein [Haloferula sargassicola]|uniref:Exosortase/archaeosortase family protein n=1 Tax=Haloferula sargassicola TaxID=490096 RepID=A0ABP9UXP0_9BACT
MSGTTPISSLKDPPTSSRVMTREPLAWAILLSALWLQLFAACSYAWRFGEYYDYGWYVPPLVGLFVWRLRHRLCQRPRGPRASLGWVVPGLIVLMAALTLLRILEWVDPLWTLPLWSQALLVSGISLGALHRFGGSAVLLRFVPILVFALTALPLPKRLETQTVASLTRSVIASSQQLLEWTGHQVQTLGDRLVVNHELIHVTDGCSGIRSAQSFLMAALFFGEWMQLRWTGRLLMIAFGIATAWTFNVARATSLAWIRVHQGESAFDQAHDSAGLLAFAGGSLVLLVCAKWLDRPFGTPSTIRRQLAEGGVI